MPKRKMIECPGCGAKNALDARACHQCKGPIKRGAIARLAGYGWFALAVLVTIAGIVLSIYLD